MVGFRKNDTLTSSQKLIAGITSGMITRFITQPLDVVKLRTQLSAKKKSSHQKFFRVTRKILKEEGILAFWHGHALGQIHSMASVSCQFFIYEMATKFFISTNTVHKSNHGFIYLLSGVLAGCCSTALVLPLEVIRVRQMLVQDQYRGLLNGAKNVYRNGGIMAFYEGLSASLCQMGPQVGISFLTFGTIQPLILKRLRHMNPPVDKKDKKTSANQVRPEQLALASSIAGSAAGFLSKTLTYPFDLSKRRMQISSHIADERYATPSTAKKLIRCEKLWHCIVKTVQKDGLIGLFRGWKVTIYKAQLTSIVAFTSYEMMCFVLREILKEEKPR